MALTNLRGLFADSGRYQSMRRYAASAVYEDLRARWRLPLMSIDGDLDGDVLRILVRLWWPWWLLLGLAHLWCMLWLRWRVPRVLRQVQVPMRVLQLRVRTRRSNPRKKRK